MLDTFLAQFLDQTFAFTPTHLQEKDILENILISLISSKNTILGKLGLCPEKVLGGQISLQFIPQKLGTIISITSV